MYNAEILADSINLQGNRITTMKITFPRIVLAEFNTHRTFSRNSASSRAIPFKKMVQMVKENPFIPIAWQKDHKGMQGNEYITDKVEIEANIRNWVDGSKNAIFTAERMNRRGKVTKQICNRILELFMWHTVIVTATEWSNFFELRCPQYLYDYEDNPIYFKSKKDWVDYYNNSQGYKKGHKEFTEIKNLTDLEWLQINKSQADIHIQAIAELMWNAYNESTPKQLKAGEWHIPNLGHEWDYGSLEKIINKTEFISLEKDDKVFQENMIKIATAHCAKISYDNFGTKINYEADIRLHDRLVQMNHWSPFEHCAKAMSNEEYLQYFRSSGNVKFKNKTNLIKSENGWCRNFKGFIQYRHLIENQNE